MTVRAGTLSLALNSKQFNARRKAGCQVPMSELILSLIWPKNNSQTAKIDQTPTVHWRWMQHRRTAQVFHIILLRHNGSNYTSMWLVFFDRVRASSFKFPVVPTNIPTLTWHWLQLNFSNVNMFSGVWTPNPKMSSHAKPSWITNLKLVANTEGKVKPTGSSWWAKDIWNQNFQSFRKDVGELDKYVLTWSVRFQESVSMPSN